MTKKRIAFVAGCLAIVLTGGMGYYRYQQARAPLRDILPAFTEAGAGPRAPTSEAFGVSVGRSGLPEVNAFLLEVEWSFADLRVRVTAVHYGARGVVVGETVEVAWPVRADAPARPARLAALDGARSTSGRRLER